MQAFLAVLTCALMLSVFLMLPTQACAAWRAHRYRAVGHWWFAWKRL